MSNEDFDNDRKDAGEIGAGTDIVVMFEIELTTKDRGKLGNIFDVNIRYKDPGHPESKLITKTVNSKSAPDYPSSDFNFACSVAMFGHLLRGSEYIGDASISGAIALAEENIGRDPGSYRKEFVDLLKKYQALIRW